jgi:hypothetical protein
VGLFSGKLMSDRKAKKLAEMRAMSDAAFAANPGAVNSLPAMDADPAEIVAMVADGQAEQELIQRIAKNGVEGPATITAMRPTGTTDLSGGRKFEFDVTIELESGESHAANVSQHLLPFQVEGLTEALTQSRPITVKYDPAAPDAALLVGW